MVNSCVSVVNSDIARNEYTKLYLVLIVGVYPNLITLYLVYNQISQSNKANNDRIKAIPSATAPRR